jgi:hypothetical protein
LVLQSSSCGLLQIWIQVFTKVNPDNFHGCHEAWVIQHISS